MTNEQIYEEFRRKLDDCDTVELSALSDLARDHHFVTEAGDEFDRAVTDAAAVKRDRKKGRHAK